jgi:hypothetical protein
MQLSSTFRISTLALSLTVVCGFLAASASARADGRNCSNRTLNGNYGGASEGSLLLGPGVALPFRALTMTHFDGNGNLTWVEHTVINGTLLEPGWATTASGTYTVNSDCTGTVIVNTPNSPVPLNLGMVIVNNGKEIHTVLDSDAVSSIFIKVD